MVAIAASAGGLQALRQVLGGLPTSFPAAVLVAQHLPPQNTFLVELLRPHSRLPVKYAEEGEPLAKGAVFVAPPGRHLEVDPDGRLSVSDSEKIRFVRPSANLLFNSLAVTFGQRGVAVVLTGMGQDGADGVKAVRRWGGYVIAQDPETSLHVGMPRAAIDTHKVDLVLPLRDISFALSVLTGSPSLG